MLDLQWQKKTSFEHLLNQSIRSVLDGYRGLEWKSVGPTLKILLELLERILANQLRPLDPFGCLKVHV